MGLFFRKCTSSARLDGKTAVVTGGSSGLGKIVVKELYERGARVIMAYQYDDIANQALSDIDKMCTGKKKQLGQILTTKLNLASLKSTRNCANCILENAKRIDLLVNNAGIMMCPKSHTADGFEVQLGINHLGHFLLTLLLLHRLCQSAPARIVNVSSTAHIMGKIDFEDLNWDKKKYSPIKAYQQSKLCNVLFTKELSSRLSNANIGSVNVYAVNPGICNTGLWEHIGKSYNKPVDWLWRYVAVRMAKSPEQGAQAIIYCAIDEACANETGHYYSNCVKKTPCRSVRKTEDAKKLWEVSLKLVGLENFDLVKKN